MYDGIEFSIGLIRWYAGIDMFMPLVGAAPAIELQLADTGAGGF